MTAKKKVIEFGDMMAKPRKEKRKGHVIDKMDEERKETATEKQKKEKRKRRESN